ncbi:MAG: 23S rRNA (uracil(1939)-C(5))-methyltransferase RlmD [Turneriella sp.]
MQALRSASGYMAGDRVQLQIQDLHPWGAGVGQHSAYGRVYTPFSFPGEQIEVELFEQVRPGQWNARRITPLEAVCRRAGECGGCAWPATLYAEQLRWKELLFRRAVAVIPRLAGVKLQVHGNHGNLGFRSRVHLHANFYQRRLTFGFYARGERRLVAIDDCPVAQEPIRRVIAELSAGSEAQWPAENFGFGIELTNLAEAGHVLLVLYGAPQRRAALEEAVPQFAALPSCPRVLIAFAEDNPTFVWQRLPAATMHTRPGCFQQVNRQQSDVVRQIIAGRLEQFSGGVFFDLYSGSGNYSLPLHPLAGAIFGCDDNPVGISLAQYNVQQNAVPHAYYLCADAGQVMAVPERYSWPRRADFIVCDPARFGLAKELPRLLARLRPRELVLVSNNTTAFVKDARGLIEAGFSPLEIHLVDFFPNTPHWNVVSVWTL